MNRIATLLASKKTVFNYKYLKDTFPNITDHNLRVYLYNTKKRGLLINPLKGYWALPNYDIKELVSIIKPQGYISAQTVLFREGVMFQYMGNTRECMSDRHVEYLINNQKIIYYKLKPSLLNNPIGIREYENYRIATPERALCDYIYLFPNGWIDAPENINKIRLKQILQYYPKSTILAVNKLINVEH